MATALKLSVFATSTENDGERMYRLAFEGGDPENRKIYNRLEDVAKVIVNWNSLVKMINTTPDCEFEIHNDLVYINSSLIEREKRNLWKMIKFEFMNTNQKIINIIQDFIERNFMEALDEKTLKEEKKNLTAESPFICNVMKRPSRLGNIELDGLDLIEAVLDIEKHFNVSIGDENIEKFATIGDVQKCVRELLLKKIK